MNTNELRKELAIVVTTCKNYEDVASLFEQIYKKKWSNNCFKSYMVTDGEMMSNFSKNFEVIIVNDNSWQKRLKNALEIVDSKYILFMMDDYFIRNEISNEYVLKLLNFAQENNIKYLKLLNIPHSKSKTRFAKINDKQPYGINLQCAIWEKKELFSLLEIYGNSPWDFEIYFLQKAKDKNTFSTDYYYVDTKSSIVIDNAVIKGKWIKKIFVDYSKIINSSIHSNRNFLSLKEMFILKIKRILRGLFPKRSIYYIKLFLRKIGFKFATNY